MRDIIYAGDSMGNIKKKIIIIVSVCIIILAGALVADRILGKSYFNELKFNKVMEKIQNKDSFVLLMSQTTCSHCKDFKPKLARISKEYKVNIYYIEIDLLTDEQNTELKSYFNFSGTPTTVFVKDGEEKSAATRINGDVSEEKIISKLKSNGFIK